MERTNARFLTKDILPDPIDLAVIDVSFIGSIKILEPFIAITKEVVLLLKPQFEAGPQDVPKGGVIRDPKIHHQVLAQFYQQLDAWKVYDLVESPISGSSGNREFLVHLRTDSTEAELDESQYLKKVEELLR
jgi:23S rRNA (cytidine1920-2'-O)/16S rRNA (cytidine1409-2'-O)-methyltransferase